MLLDNDSWSVSTQAIRHSFMGHCPPLLVIYESILTDCVRQQAQFPDVDEPGRVVRGGRAGQQGSRVAVLRLPFETVADAERWAGELATLLADGAGLGLRICAAA